MSNSLPVQHNGGTSPTMAHESQRIRRFLQYGHIFSSAVQEILEAKYIDEVCRYSLTVPQFHLLKLITVRGRHQVGEVAELLGVSSPAISKNIDKLEGLGLVERSQSKGDRRVTLLSASEEGRELVNRYEELKADRLVPVMAGFEPEEVDQLTGLLERFSLNLLRAEESSTPFCLRCAAYGDVGCAIVEVDGACPYHVQRTRGHKATRSNQEG